jgi:pimeloyl-ACP methyl ester carboxylesterase
MNHSTFTRVDGVPLAYRHTPGTAPTLVFLPGYLSDMEGGKALALQAWADARGQAMLRLDYSGCGASGGRFEDGTLDIWRDDVLALIDAVTAGPLVLVGSSMGGWLMLLVALARRRRVAGLVGIAAAPDFTRWGFSDAEKARLLADGRLVAPSDYADSPYVTTLGFWRSGESNLLLESPIALDCPVRLLHGQRDDDVPWQTALRLAEALGSADVQVTLVKDGDHRLSRPHDIALLIATVERLLESL